MSKQPSSVKRTAPVDSSLINLSVKSQDDSRLYFRIRRNAQLKKLLNAYCDKKFLPYGSCHFLINGDRFDDHRTSNQLGLENGDEIDAFLPTDGGGHGIILRHAVWMLEQPR